MASQEDIIFISDSEGEADTPHPTVEKTPLKRAPLPSNLSQTIRALKKEQLDQLDAVNSLVRRTEDLQNVNEGSDKSKTVHKECLNVVGNVTSTSDIVIKMKKPSHTKTTVDVPVAKVKNSTQQDPCTSSARYIDIPTVRIATSHWSLPRFQRTLTENNARIEIRPDKWKIADNFESKFEINSDDTTDEENENVKKTGSFVKATTVSDQPAIELDTDFSSSNITNENDPKELSARKNYDGGFRELSQLNIDLSSMLWTKNPQRCLRSEYLEKAKEPERGEQTILFNHFFVAVFITVLNSFRFFI